jgi:lipase maturation factor 1
MQSMGFMQRLGIGHIFHIYGVMQTERQELEIQGSNDGTHWLAYEFKYKPGPIDKRPPINIPHQPRLDWMMWFLPPQDQGEDYWFLWLLNRLHEGSPQVLQLFAHNPFDDAPPKYLRVVAYEYQFTSPEEKAATGNWWNRRYLGEFPNVEPRRP